MLGKLCKWSEDDKAQQLMAALRGEAQMVLLNLAEEEMGIYRTLVATLRCQFSSTEELELLQSRFRRRAWMAGESLARLATGLEREARRVYVDAATREQ
ncbi:UNVERIFIED_CONTAM: hypothetical protein FKN15_041628 [Acipenser sinensis]